MDHEKSPTPAREVAQESIDQIDHEYEYEEQFLDEAADRFVGDDSTNVNCNDFGDDCIDCGDSVCDCGSGMGCRPSGSWSSGVELTFVKPHFENNCCLHDDAKQRGWF